MSDKSFILKEFQETLTRFKEDEDKWENHTKAEYIKKCDELVYAQIEANLLSIETTGISSYLFKKINEFGVKVSDQYIRDIIPEQHTRNYNKSQVSLELTEDKWQEIETDDPTLTIEKNQYNEIKINGIEQRDREVKHHTPKEESKPKTNKETRQLTYLKACSKLANKFHLTFETLISRYNESDDIEMIIDKEIGNVEKKLKESSTICV